MRSTRSERLRSVASVRLVIARCSVDYAGRLPAHLPEATRLIMVKADGCVAIHADGGAYKPLNWMNAPNMLDRQRRPLGGHQPQGRDAHDHAARGADRLRPRARRRPRTAARTASRPTCRSCWRRRRTRSSRVCDCAARVPDGDRPDRPGLPRRRRIRWSRSRSSAAARSTASSNWRATSSGSRSTRRSATSAGVFVAQSIKPQAKVLAEVAGLPLGRGRLRRAPRPGARRPAPVLSVRGA